MRIFVKKSFYIVLLGCMFFSMQSLVYAGQSCEAAPLEIEETNKALSLSAKILNIINNYGDENAVFMLGRRGQNLDKYNQTFSHGAFVLKKDGAWIVVHELNTCGTATSEIFEQGLGQFFLDSMYKYEAAISAVNEKEAKKLKEFLLDKLKTSSMHQPHYNLLAYPFSQKYQNSNVWLLETFIAATQFSDIPSRAQVQEFLKTNNFVGTTLEIDAMTRLGARISKANIAFDDQPFNGRMNGKIVTVTYDQLLQYLSKNGWITKTLMVK